MTDRLSKISCGIAIITVLLAGILYLILDRHFFFRLRGDDEILFLIIGAIFLAGLVLAGSIYSLIAFFREQTILSGISLFCFLSVIIVFIYMIK